MVRNVERPRGCWWDYVGWLGPIWKSLPLHWPPPPNFGVGETWPLDQDGESLSPDSIRHCLAARKRTQTDGTRTSLANCPFNEKEIDRNIIPRGLVWKGFYQQGWAWKESQNNKIKSRSTCEISWMTIFLMCTTGTTTFSSMFSNTSFILNCYFMPAGLDWLVDVCRIERGWRIFSKIKLDRSKDCRMIKEEK